MSILVFIETDEGTVKKSSLEAVSYASAMNSGDVVAVAFGEINEAELAATGKSGASKVLHAASDELKEGNIQAYATGIAAAMNNQGSDILVLAKSSLGDAVAARVSIFSLFQKRVWAKWMILCDSLPSLEHEYCRHEIKMNNKK